MLSKKPFSHLMRTPSALLKDQMKMASQGRVLKAGINDYLKVLSRLRDRYCSGCGGGQWSSVQGAAFYSYDPSSNPR